ncbi:hypothetical protein HYC85_031805 [Camellia sinensis]|uniref:Uncharacterized protein n=1 Tax=Camellia sinensis TaxID=4442 RepID=A0A7J7FRL7_CAMSI|nr:hypothetical protein HYC85_031805 [Camellia sinensis]
MIGRESGIYDFVVGDWRNERHGIHIGIYKMRKSAAVEKILSYNNAVLRRSDLDILSGPYFLNYCIIEFYFSYLPSCYPSEEFVLVSPSIAFWIAKCPDIESFKDFIELLNLSSKKLVNPSVVDAMRTWKTASTSKKLTNLPFQIHL